MFVAAVPMTQRRNKGLIAWLKREKGTARYCAQEGLDYYLLTIPYKKKQPDYTALRELYPRFSGRVILADSLELPSDISALCFYPHHFERKIMLRLCTKISELLPVPLIRRVIGLVDPDGIYASFAETLIKYSPIVKVYTQNPDAYNETRQMLLDLYGAPLVMTERISSLSDCFVIFSPDAGSLTESMPRSLVVLGTRPQTGQIPPNTLALNSLNLTCDQQALVPNGIDAVSFFAAACELSGRREYLSLLPGQVYAGRRIIETADLSGYVHAFFMCKG